MAGVVERGALENRFVEGCAGWPVPRGKGWYNAVGLKEDNNGEAEAASVRRHGIRGGRPGLPEELAAGALHGIDASGHAATHHPGKPGAGPRPAARGAAVQRAAGAVPAAAQEDRP